uniref:Uncharacterized protein n=1 Tax=Rhizophora mucronata TaxID=61149 RepID=A0A2P2KQQ3_RHIMU
MALVVPLCSASSIGKLQSRPNDFSYYKSRTRIRNRNWCSSVPIKTTTPKRHRSPVIILGELDSDPLQNNPQNDEEVESLGVKAALSILRFYKREISPLLPKSCRYVPTCSEYSTIAYKKYGFVKGTIMTGWRLCRCNPLGMFS